MSERLSLVSIVAVALGSRLWFVSAFPTRPFADFRNLVRFAEAYAADGLARGFAGWELWSLGLPLALSFVLRVVPGPAPEVARYATAVVTGLTALAPFFIWRGALSLRARLIAALLLAAWPGHVFVSGVVSQDNWVLPPAVALAALAVRVIRKPERSYPVAAAVLFTMAGAVRQEMFVVLLPSALAAAGLGGLGAKPRSGGKPPVRRAGLCPDRIAPRLARFAFTAGLLVLALAGLRWAGSGRFSLGTEHQGMAVLGAAAPGAGSSYWTFAETYFAAVAPDIVEDREQMKRRAGGLALREMLRRPLFHAVRMAAAVSNSLLRTDSDGLFTSIASEEALPAVHLARGMPLAEAARPWLRAGTLLLMALATGAIVLAVRGRDAAVLLLGLTIFLKAGIHAVTAAQYRYFEVVTALALLVVALAADALATRWPGTKTVAAGGLIGAAAAAALAVLAPRAEAWVQRNEEQLTYRFVLKDPRRDARLHCVVREGLLTLIHAPRSAAIRPLQAHPRRGEAAAAECVLEVRRPTDTLAFVFNDAFPGGGFPGRVEQRVTLDGQEIARHDLGAEPGGGWTRVPLGSLEPGRTRALTLRVTALDPGGAIAWGLSANTAFELANLDPTE